MFPRIFVSGTLQSSKIISAVSLARMPNLFSFLPPLNPGVPRSTTNAVIPLESSSSPVLAKTTATSPVMPWVIQFFEPLSTQWSPSFFATHCIRKASEPVLASVKPQAPIHSAVANLGSHLCFCSSLAKDKICPVHRLLWAAIDNPTLPQTLANSSMAAAYS